jgi:hypothetical protein
VYVLRIRVSSFFVAFDGHFLEQQKTKMTTNTPNTHSDTINSNQTDETDEFVKEHQRKALLRAVDLIISKTKANNGRLPHGSIGNILLNLKN